jgi:uncharacterized protein (TIGR03032 family)
MWRDPAQINSQWQDAASIDRGLLSHRTRGVWWETLERLGITLLLTREYEHLVMALNAAAGRPRVSYLPMPHPSGLAADRARGVVHVASTRNPNQIFDLQPVGDVLRRRDMPAETPPERHLVTVRSRVFPGCLYMHDLALIGGGLFANAVGMNAIVAMSADGSHEPVWWPRCIEGAGGPSFDLNYLQLNSIAAGPTLETSFFSASTDRMSRRRPGHRNFPVDGRGVIFSGATREPVGWGLTRPHSARLHQNQVWVDNSGYGEVGVMRDGRLDVVTRLPGWTRGLCFYEDVVFVGTSRVIPRFSQYAPGLDVERSMCGVHAVEIHSGKVLGSLLWPNGNQIFAIDYMPSSQTGGFPFSAMKSSGARQRALFYTFIPNTMKEKQRV